MALNQHAFPPIFAGDNFSALYLIDDDITGNPVPLSELATIELRAVFGSNVIELNLTQGITKIPANQVPIDYPKLFKEPREGVVRIDMNQTQTAASGIYEYNTTVVNTSGFKKTLEKATFEIIAKV